MTTEEREQTKFSTRVSLRVSFTEENFTFLFYSLTDLLSEIGGLGGAVGATLSSFGVYLMMIFVGDLIMIIQRKYKQEKRMHNLDIICKKLPLFKKIIQVRLNNLQAELKKNDVETDGDEETKKEKYMREAYDKLESEQLKSQKDIDTVKLLIRLEDATKKKSDDLPQIQREYAEMKNKEVQEYLDARKKEGKDSDDEDDPPIYRKEHIIKIDANTEVDEDIMIDREEGDLIYLDDKYQKEYVEYYMKEQKDIFDELKVTKKLLNERVKYSFMHIVDLIKKRVSFFGIYALWDQVEITEKRLDHLQQQLDKKSRLLLEQQNQMRVNFNTLRKKVDPDKIVDVDEKAVNKEKKPRNSSRKVAK